MQSKKSPLIFHQMGMWQIVVNYSFHQAGELALYMYPNHTKIQDRLDSIRRPKLL